MAVGFRRDTSNFNLKIQNEGFEKSPLWLGASHAHSLLVEFPNPVRALRRPCCKLSGRKVIERAFERHSFCVSRLGGIGIGNDVTAVELNPNVAHLDGADLGHSGARCDDFAGSVHCFVDGVEDCPLTLTRRFALIEFGYALAWDHAKTSVDVAIRVHAERNKLKIER